MNRVILMGRLTRDPDIMYTQKDNSVIARFTLAVDRRIKAEGQASADFISCVSFGKQAEFCEKYLRQGTKIACEGRLQIGSYTNKEGQKIYTTDVILDGVEFAESKKSQEKPKSEDTGFINIPEGIDDELPFA